MSNSNWRLKALATTACVALIAQPTWATPAIIAGTGTGGTMASGSQTSGSTTETIITTAAVAAGSLMLVATEARTASGNLSSCTDVGSNTYNFGQANLVATGTIRIAYSYTTTALAAPCTLTASMAVANTLVITAVGTCTSSQSFPTGTSVVGTSVTAGTVLASPCTLSGGAATCTTTGDVGTPGSETMTMAPTITCTWAASAAHAMIAAAFSGMATTNQYDTGSVAGVTGSTTGSISIGPTGTLTTGEVLFSDIGFFNTGTPTEDAAFTALATTSTNTFAHAAYKIVAGTTPVTYNPSLTGTTGAYQLMLQGFCPLGGCAATTTGSNIQLMGFN